ncbi:MarR family winged helix-turn-helix transcriptional regulator [Saccharothrix coeruleofusca]|uniref:MarR family transcriptional regulator n=1 Tax=Saccharothrix coeruleofusca TaxID=33919 RepID=A0A918ED41_9PSEU|nr:MarR family transcriptional regulator [Saccharothrix coeruleofusca]MBP2336318.1 DNA-binding MarR family transcriptional regulator [Saccharothrix coeruleofusca]GGP53916.1 MarR family transcriptional regulator [Saccharothrix coeruleofusca]
MATNDYLGTRLRHLLDQLENGLTSLYDDLGLTDYRPRYTPVIRLVAARGPQSIKDLATEIGVTHSAISQTANQMARDGLARLQAGEQDARQRVVHLTDRARALLPTLDAEWHATRAAATELEAELPHPLGDLIDAALAALARRPMHDRISSHLAAPPETAP